MSKFIELTTIMGSDVFINIDYIVDVRCLPNKAVMTLSSRGCYEFPDYEEIVNKIREENKNE